MYRIIFIFLILVLIFIGCRQASETVVFDVPPGSYAYFGYDTSSTLVAKGWFMFEYEDSEHIKGKWELRKMGNLENIGPQDGGGQLVSIVSDTLVSMNLQPNFADNNIILIGKIDNKYIYGKWQWITFSGITNWGNFNSQKN